MYETILKILDMQQKLMDELFLLKKKVETLENNINSDCANIYKKIQNVKELAERTEKRVEIYHTHYGLQDRLKQDERADI
jgi:hypothetical protein